MRKAMFIAGHLRGAGIKAAEYMRSQFDGDIFVATWDREDCEPGSPPIDREAVIRAFGAKKIEIENYDVVREMMVEKYKVFEPYHHMVVCHKEREGHDSFCMMHIVERSWLLLKAYEKEIGQKYDMVVRFRPDYVFQGLPPDFQPEENFLYFPSNCVFHIKDMCAVTDNLFVATRDTMERMMTFTAKKDVYLLREKCHWTHEHIVHYHMMKNGIGGRKLNPLMYRHANGETIHGDHSSYLPHKKTTVIGTMLVRNEDDILADCIEHHLTNGVSRIILTDNGSTDDTAKIAARYPQVRVINEPSNEYRQGEWQTRMARMAYEMGADWVVPIDADEFWEGIPNLSPVPDQYGVVLADSLYEHQPTDLIEEPFRRKQMPRFHREVRDKFGNWGIGRFAFRPYKDVEVGMGQHSLVNHKGPMAILRELWIHHYPIRSYKHYAKKIKAGAESLIQGNHSPHHGTHWREAYEKLTYGTLELDYNQRRLKLRQPD